MTFKFKKIRCLVLIFSVFIVLGMSAHHIIYNILFPKGYSQLVEKYSDEYNIDSRIVYAVIKAESNFENDATSYKNAKGLMQITDKTAEWAAGKIGIEDFEISMLYEPETNIHIGCWYLNRLINQYDDYDTAFAAYNAGEGNVDKWIEKNHNGFDKIIVENIPFKETKKYVKRVNQYFKIYDFLYK